MRVALVILNFNGIKWLEQFLPSVVAYSPEAHIVVADNGSTDSSLDFLSKQYPQIQIIAFAENLGFCKGYNKALEQLEAEYFLLLNSDVEVSPNWLAKILDFMDKNPDIAVCQPKIKNYYQKTHFEYAGAAGGMLDKWGFAFCRGRIFDSIEQDTGQYEQITTVFWASGACMCVRARIWKELGGFDEYFFAHFEEIDFCWRVQNTGGKVYYFPESEVFHVGGGTLNATNPKKTFLNYRNNLITLYKNLPSKGKFALLFFRLVLDGVSALRFLKKGQFRHIWAIVEAHFAFYGYVLKNKSPQKQISNQQAILFPKAVVWQYFVKKKREFRDL
ncbi:MAG: glycosyltransferase family 2 protein [Raineya sp.]